MEKQEIFEHIKFEKTVTISSWSVKFIVLDDNYFHVIASPYPILNDWYLELNNFGEFCVCKDNYKVRNFMNGDEWQQKLKECYLEYMISKQNSPKNRIRRILYEMGYAPKNRIRRIV